MLPSVKTQNLLELWCCSRYSGEYKIATLSYLILKRKVNLCQCQGNIKHYNWIQISNTSLNENHKKVKTDVILCMNHSQHFMYLKLRIFINLVLALKKVAYIYRANISHYTAKVLWQKFSSHVEKIVSFRIHSGHWT